MNIQKKFEDIVGFKMALDKYPEYVIGVSKNEHIALLDLEKFKKVNVWISFRTKRITMKRGLLMIDKIWGYKLDYFAKAMAVLTPDRYALVSLYDPGDDVKRKVLVLRNKTHGIMIPPVELLEGHDSCNLFDVMKKITKGVMVL